MTGPNIKTILPWEDRTIAPHPAKVSPLTWQVHRQNRWPILGSHCLFHVLWHERWEDADVWLWQSADEIFDSEQQVCVLSDRLPGVL